LIETNTDKTFETKGEIRQKLDSSIPSDSIDKYVKQNFNELQNNGEEKIFDEHKLTSEQVADLSKSLAADPEVAALTADIQSALENALVPVKTLPSDLKMDKFLEYQREIMTVKASTLVEAFRETKEALPDVKSTEMNFQQQIRIKENEKKTKAFGEIKSKYGWNAKEICLAIETYYTNKEYLIEIEKIGLIYDAMLAKAGLRSQRQPLQQQRPGPGAAGARGAPRPNGI